MACWVEVMVLVLISLVEGVMQVVVSVAMGMLPGWPPAAVHLPEAGLFPGGPFLWMCRVQQRGRGLCWMMEAPPAQLGSSEEACWVSLGTEACSAQCRGSRGKCGSWRSSECCWVQKLRCGWVVMIQCWCCLRRPWVGTEAA